VAQGYVPWSCHDRWCSVTLPGHVIRCGVGLFSLVISLVPHSLGVQSSCGLNLSFPPTLVGVGWNQRRFIVSVDSLTSTNYFIPNQVICVERLASL